MDTSSLTEDQKAKIRGRIAAEAYRASLQKKRISDISLWEFANSSFGLWLFSAIIVTGLTTGVTKYIEHSRQLDLKQQCVAQLQGELLARMDHLYIAAGIHPNADFLAAAMSGGRKQKYLALVVGPRVNGIPFDQQPFPSLPTSELLRIVENSVKVQKAQDAARVLKEQAILLDLQLVVNSDGNSEDTSRAANLLEDYWIRYSSFMREELDALDTEKVSINCFPKSFKLSDGK